MKNPKNIESRNTESKKIDCVIIPARGGSKRIKDKNLGPSLLRIKNVSGESGERTLSNSADL